MSKRLRKAKGFTLVELLIVIVIIGILSATIMVSTHSATDKAEAAKIVSDLKNIQAASVMYYSDNETWPSNDVTVLNDYMASELKADGSYALSEENGKVYAVYEDGGANQKVFEKVMSMAQKGAPVSVDIAAKKVQILIRN
jgi:general secretion pathway protein G